jgi:hypothetical protein
MSALTDMQDMEGAGIGGPIAKPRLAKQNSTVRPTRLESSGSVVRVLIAPPISRRAAEISGGGAKYPGIGAFHRVNLVSGFLALCFYGRCGRSVSAPRNHFSQETETNLS